MGLLSSGGTIAHLGDFSHVHGKFNKNNDMPKQIRTLKDKQTAIIQRLEIVAPLWRKNYSEREIRVEVMRRLGLQHLSSGTVHADIKRLLKEYQKERLDNVEERVTAELARLDLVIREAWEQWEESKKPWRDVQQTDYGIPSTPDGDEGGTKPTSIQAVKAVRKTATERGIGDPRYLDIIIRALERRAKLLGLDKQQVDIGAGMGSEIVIRHVTTGFKPASSEDEVRQRDGITDY